MSAATSRVVRSQHRQTEHHAHDRSNRRALYHLERPQESLLRLTFFDKAPTSNPGGVGLLLDQKMGYGRKAGWKKVSSEDGHCKITCVQPI